MALRNAFCILSRTIIVNHKAGIISQKSNEPRYMSRFSRKQQNPVKERGSRRTTEAVNKRGRRTNRFWKYGIIDLRLFRQFIALDNAFGMRLMAEAVVLSDQTATLFSRHIQDKLPTKVVKELRNTVITRDIPSFHISFPFRLQQEFLQLLCFLCSFCGKYHCLVSRIKHSLVISLKL